MYCTGRYRLEFTPEGKKRFADFTRRNVGEILAIVLDAKMLSAPSITEPILDGRAVIRGGFTMEEAKRLAGSFEARGQGRVAAAEVCMPYGRTPCSGSSVGLDIGNLDLPPNSLP